MCYLENIYYKYIIYLFYIYIYILAWNESQKDKKEINKMHVILFIRDLKIKIRIPNVRFNWRFSMKRQRKREKKMFKILSILQD